MKKCLNPGEITASITAVANMMAKNLSVSELELLAAVLTQLADTLAVIATVRELNETLCAQVQSEESSQPEPQTEESQ